MIYILSILTFVFLVSTIVFVWTSLKMQSINDQLNTIIQEIVEREQNTKETLEDLLQQLKEIDLRGISMNPTQQQQILDLLPNVKILLSAPCNCGF